MTLSSQALVRTVLTTGQQHGAMPELEVGDVEGGHRLVHFVPSLLA